jgi:hypothetical protein
MSRQSTLNILYLDEIQTCLVAQSGNDISRATIHCELLLWLNLTTKVAWMVHPAQCPIKRAIYTGQVANIPAHFLVFTGMSAYLIGRCHIFKLLNTSISFTYAHAPDESAACMDTLKRRRAWAPQGQRTKRLPRGRDSCCLSFLPAVCLDGILGIIAHPGSITWLDFEYFLEEVLVSAVLVTLKHTWWNWVADQ